MLLYVHVTRTPHLPHDAVLAKAEEVSRLMKILAHPQRLCLLCHIAETPRTVGDLSDICALAQPQVSQFLARLKLEGLVTATRDGRNVIYSIADPRITAIMQSLASHFCTV